MVVFLIYLDIWLYEGVPVMLAAGGYITLEYAGAGNMPRIQSTYEGRELLWSS